VLAVTACSRARQSAPIKQTACANQQGARETAEGGDGKLESNFLREKKKEKLFLPEGEQKLGHPDVAHI